ncbi:hypothetical protein JXO59_14460, partial [candidate division KSB1 bacterium]|nr:hypothetical protein [candidate division KSB1 bacterium]
MFRCQRAAWLYMLASGLFLALTGQVSAANGKISGRLIDQASSEPLPGGNIIIEAVWEAGKAIKPAALLGATADLDGYYV